MCSVNLDIYHSNLKRFKLDIILCNHIFSLNIINEGSYMEKNIIYIAGPETPCARCKKTREIVEKTVQNLNLTDSTEVQHINMMSRSTLEKYGSLRGPAVIIKDTVVSEGEIPKEQHIVMVIKQLLKSD